MIKMFCFVFNKIFGLTVIFFMTAPWGISRPLVCHCCCSSFKISSKTLLCRLWISLCTCMVGRSLSTPYWICLSDFDSCLAVLVYLLLLLLLLLLLWAYGTLGDWYLFQSMLYPNGTIAPWLVSQVSLHLHLCDMWSKILQCEVLAYSPRHKVW